MEHHSQNQRGRLNYLEFRLFITGQVSRSELIQRFGISEAAATRDLAIYRDEAPENLQFDSTTKVYRITNTFTVYFLKAVEPVLLLRALIHGVGNDFENAPETMVAYELPSRMPPPSPEVLGAVSRSIFQKKVLKINYVSSSGNHGLREIVPFSLAGTGLKWMVRAFCRRKGIFCDFILNRIKSAEVLWDSSPLEKESKDFDDEWNKMLKLVLVPHPSASPEHKAKIGQEFQMVDGAHTIRVRAALAGYVLRLWSVDCSEEEKLILLPLCLRNKLALHDVDNAVLAPGYDGKPDS